MIDTSDINRLTVEDKMILIEQIWSSLKQEGDALVSPSWHEDILIERLKKIESGEASYLTLDQLRGQRK
jgi:putative addiction module component (TIGR02574 family)